jgi:hypothetical protein
MNAIVRADSDETIYIGNWDKPERANVLVAWR